MDRSIPSLPVSVLLATLLVAPAFAQVKPARKAAAPAPVVEVARVLFVLGEVEVQRQGGAWAQVTEEEPLSIGDRLRTKRGGTARIEFPWTQVAIGDASEIAIEKAMFLTLRLESGRIDIDPEQDLLRVVTDETTISGTGRTLVRREGGVTFVGSYNGGASVEAGKEVVRLGVNRGTTVSGGKPPAPSSPLPAPPRVLAPASDPRYVRPGELVHLSWKGEQASYHLEVLPIDSDVPVLSLDTDAQEFDLRLDWLGTFRWRVAGRVGTTESQPSSEGLICVVEK
jgi:hypothetical protein